MPLPPLNRTKLGQTSKPLSFFDGSFGETNYDTKPVEVQAPQLGQVNPDQISQEEYQRAADRRAGISYGDRNAGRFESALGNVVKGAGSVLTSLPKAAGEISGAITGDNPDESIFTQIGESGDDWLNNITDINPDYQNEFTQKMAQGFGSVLGNIGGGAVGAMMKAPMAVGGILTGMTSMGVEGVEDLKKSMKEQGLDVTGDDRFKTFYSNAALGISEMAPIGKALSRLNKATDGGWQRVVKNGLKGSFEEGAQEFLQQTASNFIARDIVKYDPERDIFLDSRNAAEVGGAVGMALNVLTSSMGLGRARLSKYTTPQEEADAIEDNSTDTPSTETQQDLPGFEKAVEGNGESGKVEVVNPETNQKFQTGILQSLAKELSDYRRSIKDDNATSTEEGYLDRLINIQGEVENILKKSKESEDIKSLLSEREARSFSKSIDEEISRTRKNLKSPGQTDMFDKRVGSRPKQEPQAEGVIPKEPLDMAPEPIVEPEKPVEVTEPTIEEPIDGNSLVTQEDLIDAPLDPITEPDIIEETSQIPEDAPQVLVEEESPIIPEETPVEVEEEKIVQSIPPDHIVTKSGEPYKTMAAAKANLKKKKLVGSHEVTELPGGGFSLSPLTADKAVTDEEIPTPMVDDLTKSTSSATETLSEGGQHVKKAVEEGLVTPAALEAGIASGEISGNRAKVAQEYLDTIPKAKSVVVEDPGVGEVTVDSSGQVEVTGEVNNPTTENKVKSKSENKVKSKEPSRPISEIRDQLDYVEAQLSEAKDDALFDKDELSELRESKRTLLRELKAAKALIDTSSAVESQEFNGEVESDELPDTISDELILSFVGLESRNAGLSFSKDTKYIPVPIINELYNLGQLINENGVYSSKSVIDKFNKLNEQVREKSGWMMGVDGLWRYEISDRNSRISDKPGQETTLGDLLYHDSLYKHYPELLEVRVDFLKISADSSTMGHANINGNSIHLNPSLIVDKEKLRAVLHHEIQHFIQEYEDFAPGGSPKQFLDDYAEISKDYSALNEILSPDSPNPVNGVQRRQLEEIRKDKYQLLRNAHDIYERLAGEQEARTVSSRIDMSDLQLMVESPYGVSGIQPVDFLRIQSNGNVYSVEESATIPSLDTRVLRPDGSPAFTTKSLENMSSLDQKNYNAAVSAFHNFVRKVHSKTLGDVTFVLSTEMANDPGVPEHVKEKIRRSIGEDTSSNARGVFIYDSYSGRKFIAINPLTAITNDQTSSSVIADEVTQTLFHETVGHYGMRRVFQGRSGYDNFLYKALTKNRKILLATLELKDRWTSRKNSFGETVKGSIDLSPQFDKNGKPLPTITIIDKDGNKQTYSKEGLISLADEYVAELAKDFRNPEIAKKYDTGITNFIKRLTAYIKHKLRGLMGKGAENVTQDDLMQLIAESSDRVFHNTTIDYASQELRNKLDTYSELSGANVDNLSPTQERKIVMDKDTITELSYQVANGAESKAGKLALDIGASIEDIEAIDKAIHSNVAKLSQSNWQISISNFLENFKNHPIYKKMSAMGNLPGTKMLNYLENTLKGNIAKAERLSKSVYDSLKDLEPGEQEAVYKYFTDVDVDVETLPISSAQKRLVKEAKDTIIENGENLVALGLLDKVKYDETKGAYLPNVYLKYMNSFAGGHGKRKSFSNWLKRNKDLTEEEKISLGQIKNPAYLVSQTLGTIGRDVALENFYNMLIKTEGIRQYGWILGDKISVEVNGMKMGMSQIESEIKLKEDIVRSGVGTSPHLNSPEAIDQVKSELDNLYKAKISYESQFNESISEILVNMGEDPTPEKIEKFKTTNYTKLEEKGFGHLTGLWIRKELYNDLMDYRDMGSTKGQDFMSQLFGVNGQMDRAHSWWKASKVIFNPPSWIRNAISNFVLLEISTDTSSGEIAHSLWEEVQSMRKGGSEWYDLAIQAGLSNTTYTANELYLINKDATARMARSLDSHNHQKDTGITATFNNSFGFMTEKFIDSVSFATNTYGNIETIFKVVKLKDYIKTWEKENGKSYKDLPEGERRALISEAANSANDAIFDYSKVPDWMKSMRRMPLGSPFLTFTYKAFPAVMESLARRPQKFIKYMALPYMLTQALSMSQDLDDDDVEEIKNKLPEWMREKGSMYLLPWKDSNGKISVLDASPFFPWSPHINAGLAAIHAFDDDNGILSPLVATKDVVTDLGFLGGPLPEMIRALGTNKDSFTGSEIIPSAGTSNQKMAALYNYLHTLWLPSWIGPQGVTGHLMDNLGISIITPAKTLSSFGTDRETLSQSLLRGVGVNVYGVDPNESHQSNLKTFKFKENEIKKMRAKAMKDRNITDKPKVLREFNEKLKRLRAKRNEYLMGTNL